MAGNGFFKLAGAGAAGAAGRAYDRVRMALPDGGEKHLSRADYERLPLQARIQSLLEGRLKFFLGDQEVSSREALKG